jgi:hypothetical protein
MGNDLIGAAVAASPVTVAHAQYFVALLMMQPQAAKTIRSARTPEYICVE